MGLQSYALPGAVVIGCGLIGLGLYAGLRERGHERVAAPAVSPSAVQPVESPTTSATTVVAPAKPIPAAETTQAEAIAALAKTKSSTLIQTCWDPMIKATPEPRSASYLLSIGFDANGIEVIRGISEVRGKPSRADVLACIRQQPIGIRVSPIGSPRTVEVPLDFP